MLLSRDKFRESVFKRDNYKCVICGAPAKDAHHIIERRLFSDGGYYIDNGASLCELHHIMAEQTILSCSEIREACNITNLIIPEHLYSDQEIDKWGNQIIPGDRRLRGELFYDESVQKILKSGNALDKFIKYVKYPRTYHVPWSKLGKDDKMLQDDSNFIGRNVVVTIKADGENTTMYNDYIHARSINSGSHPSRDYIKGMWSRINYMLDDNMRICGENLYAVHTIRYNNLPSYFLMFSIWIDDTCLSWNDTVEYAKILGLNTVEVIYNGIYSKDAIQDAYNKHISNGNISEGYVIRLTDEFKYGAFKHAVAKFVEPEFRQKLNQSHGHWISKKMEINSIKNNN